MLIAEIVNSLGFEAKVLNECAVRTNIFSEEDTLTLVKRLEEAENICLNRKYNYKPRCASPKRKTSIQLLHKYICHHGDRRFTGRKVTYTGCNVTLDITIHNYKDVSRRIILKKTSDELRFPCIINYSGLHNHIIQSAQSLHELRVAPQTKEKFYRYFDIGMTAAQAARFHEEEMNLDIENLANNATNPSMRAVYYLREKWLIQNQGSVGGAIDKHASGTDSIVGMRPSHVSSFLMEVDPLDLSPSSPPSSKISTKQKKPRGNICVAFGCRNTPKDGVNMHKFPWKRNPQLARKWEKLVCTTRANWKATKWSRICSAHFSPESFTSSSKLRREFDPNYLLVLEENAMPTIFVRNQGPHSDVGINVADDRDVIDIGADRDNQRPGPSDDPSQSSTSRDESSRASTERGKKGPVTKTKLGQRKRKEAANVNTTGDEVNTQEQKKEDLRSSSRTNKGGGSRSRTSKRKRTPAKANDDLQEGGVEEKEDVEKEVNVKKLKVEEERPVEKEEEIEAKEEEIEEMSDSSDMIPFQEIKIEEEDPLDAPYPLDDEVNISEAPDVALTSGILFKREEPLPWMDKTDKDKSSIAVAEEDSSKKENKPGQSKTPKTGSKSKKADSKEKNSEDLEETHKNLRKSKVVGKQEKSPSDKQQKSPSNKQQKSPSNKQQEPPAAAEVTRKRCRKILREDSQSELSELSLQLTKDIYDVFGMHVAKTLRDINDIKVFNRVKIKINEILLDALAGYYSNPGFERETSEGKPILSQDHEISNNTDSSNQDLEKRTDMKKSSSANNDTHKTTLPLSDTDQTQAVSVDHSSSVSQHSRMPIQIINPPILLPVNSSNLKPSQSKTENTCQDSRTLQTTPFVHQPGTILVNFTFPLMAQSSVVDNSRTLPTTQSIQQPGTIPGNSSFPTVTQSSDLNDSRTLEAKSIYQPGTILVNSSCPDTTRASVLDPDDNSSHHSTITETFHGTDILGGDPNITTTGPVDSSSSRSQHCVLTKTEARGIDAAQTSTIHPHGSISQHSGSPVTGHDKTHHPQVPGKKIKKETDLNPLQS
ncbi:enolase-phosphatase E1-like isoform X3 [Palaemon carinicauda]|uniref:enolase-phosphatase E1-like isoform X3 n=1 Tax=Palaemon carinicauda TaxID=392227 RepID=UPI0035B60878